MIIQWVLPQLSHDRLQRSRTIPSLLFTQRESGYLENSLKQEPSEAKPWHVIIWQEIPGWYFAFGIHSGGIPSLQVSSSTIKLNVLYVRTTKAFSLISELFVYLVKLLVIIVAIEVVIVSTAVVISLFSAVGVKVKGVSFTIK